MIAQFGQLVGSVPHFLMEIVALAFAAWGSWAIWTVLMCAPIYLIAIGLSVFGVSGGAISTLVRRTVMVNAIAASLPISLPILALWYGVPFVYRLATGHPTRRRNRQQGRQTVHNHYYLGNQRRGGRARPRRNP